MQEPNLVGTAHAASGARVTVHRGRLDCVQRDGLKLVAGDDVVVGVVDSQGRRQCRAELVPAQSVRLAALLLAPVDEAVFNQGLVEPDSEEE